MEKYRTQIVVDILIGAIGTGMMVVFPVYQFYVLVVTPTTMILVVLLWPKEREVLEDLGTQPAFFYYGKNNSHSPGKNGSEEKTTACKTRVARQKRKGEFLATELLENLTELMKIMGIILFS